MSELCLLPFNFVEYSLDHILCKTIILSFSLLSTVFSWCYGPGLSFIRWESLLWFPSTEPVPCFLYAGFFVGGSLFCCILFLRCDGHACNIWDLEKSKDSSQQQIVYNCAFSFDCHWANTIRQLFTNSLKDFWGLAITIACKPFKQPAFDLNPTALST